MSAGRIPKENVLTDLDGNRFLRCSPEFREDMYEMYGLDVDDQDFIGLVIQSEDGSFEVDGFPRKGSS